MPATQEHFINEYAMNTVPRMILKSSLTSSFGVDLLKEGDVHSVYANIRAVGLTYRGAIDEDGLPVEDTAAVVENLGKALTVMAKVYVEKTLQMFTEEEPTCDSV